MTDPRLPDIITRATPPYDAGTGWVRALQDFVAAQPPRATALPGGSAAERVRDSAMRAAHASFPGLLAPAPVTVSDAAREQLAGQLAARLTMTCARALDLELRALPPTTPLDVSADGWLDRFERWPGMAHLLGLAFDQWRSGTAELIGRLAADWPLLVQRLWDGDAPTALTEVHADAGDPHNGGRSVALLGFDGARHAVYKTKDLRSGAAFMDLVGTVADELRILTILPRDGYGWEERLQPAPCASRADVAAFYRHFGMLLRLLQLLEARDFWLDNLLACGDQPMFVDFETLVQPRHAPPGPPRAHDLVEESVAPTAAVSLRVQGPLGLRATDFGALTPSRPLTTPFRPTLDALFDPAERPVVDDTGQIVMQPPPYAPVLDGAPVGVEGFEDMLEAGYREMQDRLVARRADVERAIAAFEGLPVRAILRDTFTCHRIIFAASDPRLLVDGAARDRALRRLLNTARAEIAWSEIEAFRRLDVPLFLSRTDSPALDSVDARVVEDFFDGTAWERLRARVADLPAFPLDRHLDLLRASLESGDRAVHPPRRRATTDEEPLARAVALADAILADAITEDDGSLSWVGLTYDPFADATRVEVLRPDLLTGTSGLAVLFADLAAATGLERFAGAARAALAGSRAFARDAPAQLHAAHPSWILPCGALLGVGAPLYAIARCGAALGDAALADEALEAARALPFELLGRRSPDDITTGVVGLARAIDAAGIALPPADRERLDAAIQASTGRPAPYPPGTTLRQTADADDVAPPWDLSILWGRAGVAHALLRRHDPRIGPVRELSPVAGCPA